MAKIKRKITVRFFSIDTNNEFFEELVSINHTNWANDKPVRILNIRDKKHLIKTYAPMEHLSQTILFFSVVRERATWQVRAIADGTISGIHSNQGLIGDIYYYLVVPSRKSILGFTTGPSTTVRTVASVMLQQFRNNRGSKIILEPTAKESEYTKLKELTEFIEMRFSLNPSLLSEPDADMPEIFRELKASPFMANSSKLELTVSEFGEAGFTHEDILAAVDYLADNDCCTALFIKGIGSDGEKLQMDLNKANLTYNAHLQVRDNFVDEESAKNIMLDALASQELF